MSVLFYLLLSLSFFSYTSLALVVTKKMTAGTSKKNSSVGFVTTDTVDSFG